MLIVLGLIFSSCDFVYYGKIAVYNKRYNLNGKKLIPFTTHEGSGLGSTVKDVKKQYPEATVTGAFSIYGHEVRTEKAKVQQWLKGLGY